MQTAVQSDQLSMVQDVSSIMQIKGQNLVSHKGALQTKKAI